MHLNKIRGIDVGWGLMLDRHFEGKHLSVWFTTLRENIPIFKKGYFYRVFFVKVGCLVKYTY